MVVPPNGWFISWNIPSINGWFGGTPSQFRKPPFSSLKLPRHLYIIYHYIHHILEYKAISIIFLLEIALYSGKCTNFWAFIGSFDPQAARHRSYSLNWLHEWTVLKSEDGMNMKKVGKTMPWTIPQSSPFFYVVIFNHSQSWVVCNIVLTTLNMNKHE